VEKPSVLCEAFSKHLWESASFADFQADCGKAAQRFAFPQSASGVAVSTGLPCPPLLRSSSSFALTPIIFRIKIPFLILSGPGHPFSSSGRQQYAKQIAGAEPFPFF